MAWAVRAGSRKATHVSMLNRSETSLACACVCPACDGVLQAVNAGKTADEYLRDGAMRPFFRHHAGQQRNACLQRVAQRAALELLASHQELVLPAPTFRRSVIGASGDVYTGEATGRSYRAQITSRHWVDEQTAKLVTDDGHVILVRLSGQALVSRDAGVDAVLTISIDDPLVSTWSPDEILARVQLDERWLCWESHWDEDDLAAQALADAQSQAREALDLAPDDLVLPEGLTHLQRCESVLHAVIKQILAEAKSLRVPVFESEVGRRTLAGRLITYPYGWSPVTLALTNVRLETRVASIVHSTTRGSGMNDGVDDIADRTFSDVAEGKLEFARLREFDDTIRLAFPELGDFLDSAKGTVTQAEAFRAMVRAQQEALQAKAAEAAIAQRAVEAQKRREAEHANRLQKLNAQYRWRTVGEGGIRTPEASKQLVKNLFPFESLLPRNGLIDQAWEARANGTAFAEFVTASKYFEELGFDQAMVILKGAWVVTER
jgi:hypothetical protein